MAHSLSLYRKGGRLEIQFFFVNENQLEIVEGEKMELMFENIFIRY